MVEGCSHNISIENALVTNNGAFGVRVYGSGCSGAMNVVVDGSTIQHNGTGIRLDYDSLGNKITGNELINNDRMLVNDATPGNDNGANAIQFYKTYGSTLVSGNVAHGNRATSHDYGYDGGAFEIFGASDLDIRGNVVWDNMNILETGTNSGVPCANNRFTDNVAYGGNDKSQVPLGAVATGLILRCATNMLIANNSFDDIDWWVFDIQQSGGYSGALSGLRILNNIVSQRAAKIYAFEVGLPADSVIDNNDVYNTGGAPLATVTGHGNADDMATLRTWTGADQHGTSVDPRYASPGGHDYHLQTSSPVIDLGETIAGVTDGYLGVAPDLGRYETR